ncbi:MAG: hypothetical protein Q8L85_04590 [Alphaproteobacteria bacterium]|nr:hypothetical protein [Alphaproteobacteria bacterium]
MNNTHHQKQTIHYAIVSRPFLSTIDNNFNEAPEGLFSPLCSLLINPVITLR